MSEDRMPLRALLVEDSEDDAFFIVRALKLEGFDVNFERVDKPEEMRRALEQSSWDAVISDYQMPAFDGLAALGVYDEFDLDIPFIIVSGAVGEETAVKVMKAGAHDYLIKDNLTRLAPAIRRELQEAKLRQERREALQALQRSEARYRAIVEDQTELISRCTLDGTITYVNEAYARLHDRTPEELIGKTYQDFLKERSIERLRRIRTSLTHQNPVVSSESAHTKSDGTFIWIQWRDRLIFDQLGNPIEYQGVGRDITEQKQVEAELRSFANNLERRAVQLQVAAEIARDATSVRELDDLLNRAVNLVRDRFGFYHAGVFLIDDKGEYAVLAAGTGETGRHLVTANHKLKVGEVGIVGHVAGSGQPRIVLDVGVDAIHLVQPLLPETRSEMALPLKVGHQVIGVLDVQSEKENAFDDEDLQILQTMADQLAIAIDNLRLLSEVQHRAEELEGLYSAALVTSSELEVDALLSRLYEQVQRFIHPDAFILALYSEDQQEIHLALAMEAGNPIPAFQNLRVPLEEGGLSGYVIKTRKSLLLNDVETEKLPVEPIRDPHEKYLTRAWLGIPLIVRDKILGVVSVQSFRVAAFDRDHQRFLESLASQAAIAYENARLFEAERAAREQAETLREIAHVIGGSLDINQVLNLILEQIKRVVVFDTASVLLFDQNQEPDLVAGIGYEDEKSTSQSASALLKDSPILQQMAGDLLPITISDVTQHQGWIWIPGAEHVRSFLGVPILARQKMIGALMVDHVKENAFSYEDAHTLQTVAQHIAIAIETVRLFEAERAQLLLARTLQEVGMLLTSQLGLNEVLEKILDLLGRVVFYDSVSVQLMDSSMQLYFAAGRGFDDREQIDQVVRNLSAHNLTRLANNEGNAIVFNDTTNAPDWIQAPEVGNIRSWICAPLQSRGKLIGLLTVDSHQPNAFSDEVGNTVMAFANQAAIAIENAQLFEAERSARERSDALLEAAQVISSSLSLNQVIEVVLEQLARVLSYDSGSVILLDGNRAYVQTGWGYDRYPDAAYLSEIEFDLSVEGIRYVVEERKPLVISDVLEDRGWKHTAVTGHVRSWMGVPLQVRDHAVGIISLERSVPGGFNAEEVALAQVFAAHTSTAIENARLFEAEEKRAQELETLREVGLSLTGSLEPEAVLNSILEGVHKLMPRAWHMNIYLSADNQLSFGAEYWVEPKNKIALLDLCSSSLISQVASSGEALVDTQVLLSRIFADLDEEELYGSLISLPLKVGERVVGVLNVVDIDSHEFLSNELRVLHLLADQAALAIENAHLFQQTIKERRHISLLYDVGRAIAVSLEPEMILKVALDLTCSALDGNMGSAWLFFPDENKLYGQAFYNNTVENRSGFADAADAADASIELGYGLVGWVAQYRQPVKIASVHTDERWVPIPNIEIESMLAAPILEGENLLGVIAVHNRRPDVFDDDHLNLLQAICQQVGLALSNARRYQDVDRLVSLLAAEQYRLEGLIEMLPVGVLLLDEEHNLLVTNSLARTFLAELAPQENSLVISHLGQYSIAELFEHHADPLPVEIVLGELAPKIFEVQAQPIGTEKIQWIITLREVTQEREIQDRIQMQERLATVGQLAAGIAHDFNNIMAAIVVYADLLLMDPGVSASSRERLTIIQQQVQRAASLIRQILDFSRRSVMEQNTLDLLPLLKEMEKLLNRTLPETIVVELHYQEDAYLLSADPTRLQQVFMNLAVNARDAMPNGGNLRFEISRVKVHPHETPPSPEMPPGDWLLIKVSDTGMGISAEDQSHIFEPFFTTKPIGQGTGLGLAQVYGIVKQHGGYIDLISKLGEGTQFNIYLPAFVDALEETQPEPIPTEIDGGGKTVLLVEDDPATRKALEVMLKVHNYRVLIANNGLKALELLEQEADAVVLVVSDVVMPQMGGLDLYECIQPRWPEIQMLFITGHPLDEKNQDILQQGKVHWLQKPFTVQEFNQTLIELLA